VERVCVVVQFSLVSFPEKQPRISLMSVYGERNAKAIDHLYLDYPYSPRWPFDEMAARIM
jgi:hypothetical protein